MVISKFSIISELFYSTVRIVIHIYKSMFTEYLFWGEFQTQAHAMELESPCLFFQFVFSLCCGETFDRKKNDREATYI